MVIGKGSIISLSVLGNYSEGYRELNELKKMGLGLETENGYGEVIIEEQKGLD